MKNILSREERLKYLNNVHCNVGSDLEFAQLQLHHVLIGGLNEHSREQFGVGLHLK